MLPKSPKRKQKVVHVGDREVALAQQGQLDHGIVVAPLPPNRERDRHNGDREKSRDKMALQPVVALATIQHDFKAGESDRDQADPDVVDPKLASALRGLPFLGEFDRIVNQPAR